MTVVTKLFVAQIVAGDNDRTQFNEQDLRDLAESISQHGLIELMTVRPLDDGRYEIVAGERRYRAIKMLGWDTVECIIRELDDRTADGIMLQENLKRSDLDAIDEAMAYQKRIDRYGMSVRDLSADVHVSETRIYDRLALLKLNSDIQHLVRHRQLPLKYANAMSGLDKNFQRVAMRYFQQAKRPNREEFRAVCNDLKEKQNQLSFWDRDNFLQNPTLPATKPRLPTRKRLVMSIMGGRLRFTFEYEPGLVRKIIDRLSSELVPT